jgi:hypothetical protein
LSSQDNWLVQTGRRAALAARECWVSGSHEEWGVS